MQSLLTEIGACQVCAPHLEHGVRPVFAASPESKIVIIGQAPGIVVHKNGIPWHDKSGDNLRNWLNIDRDTFYDPKIIALIPMGFCYPGKGKSGDLPPRKECAPLWHRLLFENMKQIRLKLLIGQYAQAYYLKEKRHKTLTETVRHYEDYLPEHFVLPHPSPRNNIWQAKNKWFKEETIPNLQQRVAQILQS